MALAVLVVEDDALIRMAAAEIVKEMGCVAYAAANADDAVDLLEAHPEIALLFTDIDMPGTMDGLELAEVVHTRWPHVRLIVTSAHTQVPDDDLPDHGKFIQKPYYPVVVQSAMHDALAE
jgi:CheY-like chemotaxis protein